MLFSYYIKKITFLLEVYQSTLSTESIVGVGVRMTQRQNDTVRHFGTEGHFGTATKWHGASLWHGDKMTRCVTLA